MAIKKEYVAGNDDGKVARKLMNNTPFTSVECDDIKPRPRPRRQLQM